MGERKPITEKEKENMSDIMIFVTTVSFIQRNATCWPFHVMSIRLRLRGFMMSRARGDKSPVCCWSQYWEPGNAVSELWAGSHHLSFSHPRSELLPNPLSRVTLCNADTIQYDNATATTSQTSLKHADGMCVDESIFTRIRYWWFK